MQNINEKIEDETSKIINNEKLDSLDPINETINATDSKNIQEEALSAFEEANKQKAYQEYKNANEDIANEDIDSKIIALNKKIEELKNENLRIYADFENFKKRLEREKNQVLEYANENFSKDLLNIIDSLEKAYEVSKDNENISQGIGLVLENLNKIFLKHGITEIDTTSEFDPNIHDCIMQVQNEEKNNGEISCVLQKGYKYKDRVIRAAMVGLVKN